VGYTVWSPFAADSTYLPSSQPFMINYRVDDLEALVVALRAEGVRVVGEIEQHENGKFAWIVDPDGTKIELWEPVPSAQDPYL
jgi:predicted enzyme related to lactoylglutathione lyase